MIISLLPFLDAILFAFFIYIAPHDRLFFTGNQVFFIIIYFAWARGEIGRRAGFRFQWGNPWGFKSPRAHHQKLLSRTKKCAIKIFECPAVAQRAKADGIPDRVLLLSRTKKCAIKNLYARTSEAQFKQLQICAQAFMPSEIFECPAVPLALTLQRDWVPAPRSFNEVVKADEIPDKNLSF